MANNSKKSYKQLFTRETANKGRKMPLKSIRGDDLGEWLMVLGSESDVFANIKADYMRDRIVNDDADRSISLAPMITGWSFDEECNRENVNELFNNAPYISDAVDVFSRNEANTLKKD